MIKGMCVSTVPALAPLKLAPDFRAYFGAAHEHLCELIDKIANADCYRWRVFHVPDGATENAGIPAGGYAQYALQIEPGSMILGFLHSNTPVSNPNNAGSPPVGSGYRCQITDVQRNYRFFDKPVPEAYFLNDIPSTNALGPYSGNRLYLLNPSLRLLMAPYPVAPAGQFKIEFWNIMATTNNLVELDIVVAEPDTAGVKA